MTLENTFNLFLSQLPLFLLGLLTHLQALDFSRSRACLFWRIRELAIAAAIAATAPTPLPGQTQRVWVLAAGAAASMLLSPSPKPGAEDRAPDRLGGSGDTGAWVGSSPCHQDQDAAAWSVQKTPPPVPGFSPSQLLAGESLQAGLSVSREMASMARWATLRAALDAPFTRGRGTCALAQDRFSFAWPQYCLTFHPPSLSHSNPSKHLLDSNRVHLMQGFLVAFSFNPLPSPSS